MIPNNIFNNMIYYDTVKCSIMNDKILMFDLKEN